MAGYETACIQSVLLSDVKCQQTDAISAVKLWYADKCSYDLHVREKVQLHYTLSLGKDLGKDPSEWNNRTNGQSQEMYTDDEIHEICEREADKWRSYIRKKDEKIDLLLSQESLLKYTIESLSNQLQIQKKMSLAKSLELDMVNKKFNDYKLASTHSTVKEDMDTIEVKEDYLETLERETVDEWKLNPENVDKPKADTEPLSDKTLILQEEMEALQQLDDSENEEVQVIEEEGMKELESQTTSNLIIQVPCIFPTPVFHNSKAWEMEEYWNSAKTIQKTSRKGKPLWVL